ncbi:RDD family protein [Pedobacter riviphilus]|uniref:RDD family protein n=1 Tax=Pedobacter riviphilus TaxID=2766984 RepID=A0ABX6TBJ8_9SPHI|nr:RDD family protein [Pedobacter riviphilus]QNR82864.1 RDD family protein [Pedobacter riviphilus]
MQKIKSKLTIFIIVTSLFTLVAQFLPRFSLFDWLYLLLSPFSFSFKIPQVISYEAFNLIFRLLFLISGILYYTSKGKQCSLARFLFSVILIDRAVRILKFLLPIIFSFSDFMARRDFSDILLSLIANVFWAYLSFRVLSFFNTQKKIHLIIEDYGGDLVNYVVEAKNWQRVFHLIIDSIIMLIVFYPLLETIARIKFLVLLLDKISLVIGDKALVILIFASFKLIFYSFFEKIFQSSPAKFITGTRVVNKSAEMLKFKTIMIRTLSRFVPFDILSFIFANTGWHDQWSDTLVVKEENIAIQE